MLTGTMRNKRNANVGLAINKPAASAPVAPMPRLQKEETVMESQVQSPDFLIGEAAESAVANTIGTLMRSISKDRAVSVRIRVVASPKAQSTPGETGETAG